MFPPCYFFIKVKGKLIDSIVNLEQVYNVIGYLDGQHSGKLVTSLQEGPGFPLDALVPLYQNMYIKFL